MAGPQVSNAVAQEALDAFTRRGSVRAAAAELGVGRATLDMRLIRAKERGLKPSNAKPFEVEDLPDGEEDTSELIQRRIKAFKKRHAAKVARKLIQVQIKIDGPIGIAHFGDPHVDDDGCDFGQLETDINIVNKTEGLFGANVGDMQNNWIGRLSALYGQQGTSERQAWALTEWMVRAVDWLYLIGGNHDAWSGEGDPLKWITANQTGVYEAWGVRLNLNFPNRKQVRVNARHDFKGTSMWNPVHGPMKAVQAGWRDHILTCGHLHVSAIAGPLKDPASGLLSWAIRCGGYKIDDRFAVEMGLPDQNAFPTCVTIIDPRYADDDPRLVTVIPSVEMGADFLKFLRRRK